MQNTQHAHASAHSWPPTKKNFVNRVLVDPNKGKYPIQDVLDGKYPNFPVHRLKDKLIRSNIKKAECEQCGFHERRITDGKLPLLLNFEDGNKHNHALVNLKLLCYNCTFKVLKILVLLFIGSFQLM